MSRGGTPEPESIVGCLRADVLREELRDRLNSPVPLARFFSHEKMKENA
jgi:hypothetical protein